MRVTLFLLILLAAACDDQRPPTGDDLEGREAAYRAEYEATPISLSGVVRTTDGEAVVGAQVEVQGVADTTDADGEFRLSGLSRRTSFVLIDGPSIRSEYVPAWLSQPLEVGTLAAPTFIVERSNAADVRLLFGGDVSLGRRFLNADPPIDQLPADDPEALIKVSDAEPGTRAVLAALKPYLDVADFTSVNLETVVTAEPDTPFDSKPYIFYTLPESLPALQWWGVDYVALGNNHIYDYLEKGVVDTLAHLRARGIPFSGAGRTPDLAFLPYRRSFGATELSMVSMITFDGRQYPILWTVDDSKAGAAYAWDSDRVEQVLQGERAAGRVPIVNLHTGREYAELPTDSGRERMLYLADAGAALVISHHPHVPQGFEWSEDVLIAHSLGNLVFDQERLETVLGLLLYVDMKDDVVVATRVVPIWLEQFRPRAIAGAIADILLRRIAEGSLLFGTESVLHNGQLWLLPPGERAAHEDRVVEHRVEIGSDGVGYIDLRQLAASDESLVELDATGLTGQLGRDIMIFGDVEDLDVDDEFAESANWYTSGGSSYPCLHEVNRGSIALCSFRRHDGQSTSVVNFRNRVRVLGNATEEPNKDLTFLAWLQGEHAGRVTIDVNYYAPLGPKEFGGERIYDSTIGSSDWSPVWRDLSMPPDEAGTEAPQSRTDNARALRIFIEHFPPLEQPGMARFDDFAIVAWDPEPFADEGTFASAHPHDFVRLRGEPGSYSVTLTFRTLQFPD